MDVGILTHYNFVDFVQIFERGTKNIEKQIQCNVATDEVSFL